MLMGQFFSNTWFFIKPAVIYFLKPPLILDRFSHNMERKSKLVDYHHKMDFHENFTTLFTKTYHFSSSVLQTGFCQSGFPIFIGFACMHGKKRFGLFPIFSQILGTLKARRLKVSYIRIYEFPTLCFFLRTYF